MTARLSPQREAEIAARAEAATPGPWELYEEYGPTFLANVTGAYLQGVGDFNFGVGEQAEADEAFVRHSREDVDLLRAELAAVRAERDQLQRRFDELETLGRELLSHCTAEYGGPGYTHCELPTGHDGQHESALGHMRRATWGGEAR